MPSKPRQILHQSLRILGLLGLGFACGRAFQWHADNGRFADFDDALRTAAETTRAALQTRLERTP